MRTARQRTSVSCPNRSRRGARGEPHPEDEQGKGVEDQLRVRMGFTDHNMAPIGGAGAETTSSGLNRRERRGGRQTNQQTK